MFRLSKKKRSGSKNSAEYIGETVNLTPYIVRILSVVVLLYVFYSAIFYKTWGILPYTFNYTVYMVDEDYPDYGVDDKDILLVKYSKDYSQGDLALRRVGTEYELTMDVRNPYGVVVSKDIFEDARYFLLHIKKVILSLR